MHLGESSFSMVQIQDIQVVEKTAVETAEHNKALAKQDARVSPSRLWFRMADLDLAPFLSFNIELMDVADVLFIPSS